MKYAHLADLHLGSWRDQKMRDLSTKAFLQAIDECVAAQVDFILFAGDLFHTSLPSLDILKIVSKKLKELKDKGIPLYVIAGSHDFSPSGKTMVDVLENAGLFINVCKGRVNPETRELHLQFVQDPKTGAKITGMLGRKGQLDQKYYEKLHLQSLEEEQGYKIFMFHTTVTEMLGKDLSFIDSQPVSYFPKRFAYYAGGHIHHPTKLEVPEYGVLTYTGALFPNNFAEMEKYGKGGYYIVNGHEVEWKALEVCKHEGLQLDCSGKSPEVITFDILQHFQQKNLQDVVVTIRLQGEITGRVSEINFRHITETLYKQGAYFVMKNTAKLHTTEFEEISIAAATPEQIEELTIKEHLQQFQTFDKETELRIATQLLHSLNTGKKEGETVADFTKRVEEEVSKVLQFE